MRKILIATLLLLTIACAEEGDSSLNTDFEILQIPPSVGTIATSDADRIEIYGLPTGSEVIDLPRGWRILSQRGDMTVLQGPPTNQPTTIKFTSPDPKWEATVVGYKGSKSIWNADHIVSSSQHK
jgi:hypothetical protein